MAASGQKVNKDKSEIYFLNTNKEVENQICKVLGFKKGQFPGKYLGIALEKGANSSKIWQNTIEKVDARIGSWKDKWLSKAGKCTKIKSVLSAIPTFPLSCLPLSKSSLSKLESKLRNFLWKDCEDDKKLALIKWDNICKPKELGGLGIKNLQWQNEALGAKLIWRLFKERNQKWARILYNKYLNAEDPLSIFRMRNLPKGSVSWNFMSKCRHIISKFLSWDVGLGDEALFWEDSWDGFPPIVSRPFPSDLKDKLVSIWGEKVCDYKMKITSGGSAKWVWKSLDGVGIDSEVREAYEKILLDRRVKQMERKDMLIWAASKDGKYSVRNGYNSLIHSQRWDQIEIPLNLCWDAACLPKAGFFLWLASQNRILTEDRLHKFGFQGPSRCVLCKHNIEDVDHLLYRCPFSQSCWEWLRLKLGWSSPLPKSFFKFLIGWPTNMVKGIYNKLWNICPAIVSWEIWKERNRRIFQDSEMELEGLLLKMEASIVEVSNSHLRKVRKEEGSFSSWDGLMKKNWSKLINPPLVYSKSSKMARKDCKWFPPPHGWHKLNFDGAARGNPGTAGIGCIINDDSGNWIAKKALSIRPTTNNFAELEALEKGLLLCLELGLTKVIIEGDSQIILNAIRKRATPNWALNSKLSDVLTLIDQLADSRICHILREGNQKADALANKGADGVNFQVIKEV
jgi:ribonuclease HI